jgi:Na+-driven multidrug efflux pump
MAKRRRRGNNGQGRNHFKMEKHMASLFSRRDTDMTTGGIAGHLVSFAMPLLIGNIFQQLYNTVDSIVVGTSWARRRWRRWAASPGHQYAHRLLSGAGDGRQRGDSPVLRRADEKGVHEAVHTTLAMTFILCVVFTAVGAAVVPYMPGYVHPEDVYARRRSTCASTFTALGPSDLQHGLGILRAVGDSGGAVLSDLLGGGQHGAGPGVCNHFGWGVAGVAIATVTAQGCRRCWF